MRKVTRISLALGSSAALLSLAALPASALEGDELQPPVSVRPEITVPRGPLSISIPTDSAPTVSVSDFDANLARTAAITVPGVAVTDHRATDRPWNVSVTLTDFGPVDPTKESEGGKALSPISAQGAVYRIVNAEVAGAGNGLTANSVKLVENAEKIAAGTFSAGIEGNNVASWNAVVDVSVPANILMSDYVATLTHSVY